MKICAVSSLLCIAVVAGCQADTTSNVKVDYYAVSGNSTRDIEKDIRRKGPKVGNNEHAVAVARIKMFPQVKYSRREASCRVRTAKVTVNARVTLPKWTGAQEATPKLNEAWDNMDRYTRLHEAVHVAIAFRYAERMEKALVALEPAPRCAILKTKVNTVVDGYLKEHDAAQKKFDSDEASRFARIAKEGRVKLQASN